MDNTKTTWATWWTRWCRLNGVYTNQIGMHTGVGYDGADTWSRAAYANDTVTDFMRKSLITALKFDPWVLKRYDANRYQCENPDGKVYGYWAQELMGWATMTVTTTFSIEGIK